MTDPTPAAPEQFDSTASNSPTVPSPRLDAAATEPQATVPDKGQAHDPWSRDADTVAVSSADAAVAYPATNEFEPVTGFAPADEIPPVKRRGRTPIVLAIVAVLIVVLGAGAYAGVRYYTGSNITEPESAVPASVGAFARIDLSPGLRDKLSFNDLVKKFPTKTKSTEDLVTKVETQIATRAGLNYNADVKPWFGGQAGVAEWTNASGDPVALLVFSSKDDAKARATLLKVQAKQGASFGFALRGGYALIAGAASGAQADATAAAADAGRHNLADSANYKSAVSHISGHNLVIAYADLGELGALLSKEVGNIGALASGAGDDGLPLPAGAASAVTGITGLAGGAGTDPFAKLTGTVIVGAAVVSDGIEIRTHAQGLGSDLVSTGASTNVRPVLDAMPDTTTLGVALDGVDPNSASGKQLTQMLSSMSGNSGDDGGPTAMLTAVGGPLMSVLTSRVISLSITGVAGDLPSGFLAVDTRDGSTAASLVNEINALTSGASAVPGLAITAKGTHVQATLGGPTSTGKLGGTSLFTEATAGMSNETSMVYLNFTKLVSLLKANGAPLSAKTATAIAPIKAIAVGGSTSGTSEDSLIRIVIK